MLNQLMWKDIRNQRGVLILGLLFLIGPYLLYFLSSVSPDVAPEHLANMAILSVVFSQMTVVVMGATIIGNERQDRGLDFLLALPVRKSKVLLSKSLVCLLVALFIWGVFLAIVETTIPAKMRSNFRPVGTGAVITGFALFGIAWLGSIFLRSAAASTAIALAVVATLATVIFRVWAMNGWSVIEHPTSFAAGTYSMFLLLGGSCFVAGWILFARRLEP